MRKRVQKNSPENKPYQPFLGKFGLKRYIEDMKPALTFPSTKTTTLTVPWVSTAPPPEKYEPVDCDFTDELEFVSVKKITVVVKYWNQNSTFSNSQGLISDIVTANQEENLIMLNGDRIRLDRIVHLRII